MFFEKKSTYFYLKRKVEFSNLLPFCAAFSFSLWFVDGVTGGWMCGVAAMLLFVL